MILPFWLPPVQITVDADRVLNRVSRTMYGACLEDVNHEVYGGLYAQRIFGESFEEPAPGTQPKGWHIFGGSWSPEGDGVHVQGGSGSKLVREMPVMSDGEVEADVRISNDLGDNAGLLVRVSRAGVGADDFVGYEISLNAKQHVIVLGKHQFDFHSLLTVSAPLVPGQWHHLRVTMAGPRLRVYLDRESNPRIDFVDSLSPIMQGRIALRIWNADASFGNVRVDGKPAPLSFTGDGVSRMWDRVLTGSAKPKYALDEGAFNGKLCQRIEYVGGSGRVGIANRGLNRWGISVIGGHTMDGRVYLKGNCGPVTVALQSADGTSTYASQQLVAGAAWVKAAFRLKPTHTDPNARFALWIDRPGKLWVDQAVLQDARQDRFANLPVRKDIADKLVGSGITFLRYGGTMINVPGYRWKNMIGDPDLRPPYTGNWYPASTNGFGIFDFLRFCEAAKVGSAFALNVDETPQDAADLADYLTAPTTNLWGHRRAQDGHPGPYKLDYIEIGNEEGVGNPDSTAMEYYANRFRILAQAIHSRNPAIKLVCSAWWVPDASQMKTVFDAIDGVAAAWDFHFWSDDPNAGGAIDRELDRAQRLFTKWDPHTTLKVVVFEENGNRHDQQRALGHASTVNATRRHGDFVLVDCAANALQPWRQNDNGWDQGGVFFTTDHAWMMPPAYVRQMLARNHLPLRVAASGDLDVLATRSEDGQRLCLTMVNATDQPRSAHVDLGAFRALFANVQTISAQLAATIPKLNSYRLSPENQHSLEVTLPGFSVTSVDVVARATHIKAPRSLERR